MWNLFKTFEPQIFVKFFQILKNFEKFEKFEKFWKFWKNPKIFKNVYFFENLRLKGFLEV